MTINTNQNLETALIGGLLVAPKMVINVVDKIKPTDFTDTRAMTVYLAILAEYQKKKAVNIASITAQLPELCKYLTDAIIDPYPPGVVRFAQDIAYAAKTRRIQAGNSPLLTPDLIGMHAKDSPPRVRTRTHARTTHT